MGGVSDGENKFLNSLILDCITYKLTQQESLAYIKARFREISMSSYCARRARVQSDKTVQNWLNHFTRVGFVKLHKEQLENAQRIQDDSLRQLQIEMLTVPRNRLEIHRLKNDIRENIRLITDLGLGTPIISAIKAKLDKSAMGAVESASSVQERREIPNI